MEFIYVLNPKAAEELMAQGFGYTTSTMNGNLVWIFDYNDEQDHNMELAKQCSICGSCFEMLYLDEDAKIRLARVPAANGIMICETDSGFSTLAGRSVCGIHQQRGKAWRF